MQWIEAHRAHDIDRLVKFPTDDVTVQSDAGVDMPPAKGKEQAQDHWQAIYSTFPDFRMERDDR
jgi:ketosteroid isomerase-like protein